MYMYLICALHDPRLRRDTTPSWSWRETCQSWRWSIETAWSRCSIEGEVITQLREEGGQTQVTGRTCYTRGSARGVFGPPMIFFSPLSFCLSALKSVMYIDDNNTPIPLMVSLPQLLQVGGKYVRVCPPPPPPPPRATFWGLARHRLVLPSLTKHPDTAPVLCCLIKKNHPFIHGSSGIWYSASTNPQTTRAHSLVELILLPSYTMVTPSHKSVQQENPTRRFSRKRA